MPGMERLQRACEVLGHEHFAGSPEPLDLIGIVRQTECFNTVSGGPSPPPLTLRQFACAPLFLVEGVRVTAGAAVAPRRAPPPPLTSRRFAQRAAQPAPCLEERGLVKDLPGRLALLPAADL